MKCGVIGVEDWPTNLPRHSNIRCRHSKMRFYNAYISDSSAISTFYTNINYGPTYVLMWLPLFRQPIPDLTHLCLPAKLTFYTAIVCPYAQRTAIALKEVGAEYEKVEIDLQNKPSW
jgi:hypothetical protein